MQAAKTTNGMNHSHTKTMQPLASYTPEETKLLKEYYSVLLALLVGIKFVHNAEHWLFSAELTKTE